MHRRDFLALAAAAPLAAQSDNRDPALVRLLETKWVNEPKPGQLPTGVSHRTYRSKALGKEVGYCVYLPPSYDRSPGRRYPVIYNLHDAGGNEVARLRRGGAAREGHPAGKLPEMILAMPNGGKTTFYKDSYDGKWPAETMTIREFIPLIDAQFRTIPERAGRCIEGFSMGGRGSTRLAMKYPEMFCSLFNQAGNVPHTSQNYDPSKPEVYPNFYLGPNKQNYIDNDVFLLIEKNLDKIKQMRIQVWCGTKDDGHLPTVREYHQALVDAGVDHTYMEIEGLAHKRTEMIARYADIWFDYHVESLHRSGALA
ncbi:MAG: alpha/beta hydrolase-fold protein [Bryobacterales bacterium]